MSTKVYPEKREIICDVCMRVCGSETPRLHHAKLVLKRDALDYQNNACADASLDFDLCDECMKAIADGINAAAVRIRSFVGKKGDEG